jgi:hypothetical protein
MRVKALDYLVKPFFQRLDLAVDRVSEVLDPFVLAPCVGPYGNYESDHHGQRDLEGRLVQLTATALMVSRAPRLASIL